MDGGYARVSGECLELDDTSVLSGSSRTNVKFGKVDGGLLSETMLLKRESGNNFFSEM